MALSKIQSESVNLADNFAFTGTVSGAGGGKVLKMAISELSTNTTRSSATSFADDLDFGSFTPSATNSTIFIQGVANMDSDYQKYTYIRWVVNGANYLSTGGSTPLETHAFYSNLSLNAHGLVPSTIMTSVSNTDGSAITVKCQGKTSSGTLYINRGQADAATGSPSSVIFTEVSN